MKSENFDVTDLNSRGVLGLDRARRGALRLEAQSAGPVPVPAPSFLVDEIAREEWDRVAGALFRDGLLTAAQRSLLAGYCTAVAKAARAEQTLAIEGRYYETRTGRGSTMRRRHPAAQDAEQGWTAARHFAKQLGLTGGSLGEREPFDPRRNLFK